MILKPQDDRLFFQLSHFVCGRNVPLSSLLTLLLYILLASDVVVLSSWASLSLSRSLPLFFVYLYPLFFSHAVPYTLFCIIRPSLPLSLPTRLVQTAPNPQSVLEVGCFFLKTCPSHFLSIVAPTKGFSSPHF